MFRALAHESVTEKDGGKSIRLVSIPEALYILGSSFLYFSTIQSPERVTAPWL